MNEIIVFSISTTTKNQSFIVQTMKIFEFIYENDGSISKFEDSDFKDLSQDIYANGGMKANYNLKEFILFAMLIRYISRKFEINKENQMSDFLKLYYGKTVFNFEDQRSLYLNLSEKLISDFRKEHINSEVLNTFDNELDNFSIEEI